MQVINQYRKMSDCYSETLLKIMETNKSVIVCDADLANSSGAKAIFERYPDRTVDFGISEANMVAAAGGMSLTGLKPVIHSFAPFVTRRVLDQIYVSLALSKNNCFIYGSDPGYWSKYNGPTHTTFEDIAITTSIPGMNVIAPSDITEFKWILEYYAKYGGLFYVRAPRQEVKVVYPENEKFNFGQSKIINQGKDVAIITCGPEITDAEKAIEKLKLKGIEPTLLDLFFLKPLDKKTISNVINKHKLIITVENHNSIGGIGQQIAMLIASSNIESRPILKSIAVNDRFGEVGTVDYLKKILGITAENIEKIIVNY